MSVVNTKGFGGDTFQYPQLRKAVDSKASGNYSK